jgi:hypothetical protein
VVVKAEMPVVDPNRMVFQRNEMQLLAIARDEVQVAFSRLLDALKIDSTVVGSQLGGFVDQG